MAKVTILFTTYNHESYIAESLRSVLDQTHHDLEVLVLNDGSVDRTESIVESFRDPRVTHLYKQNGGVSSALNLGLARATGDYIALMSGDDVCERHRIEQQLKDLTQFQADFVFCRPTLIDERSKVLPDSRMPVFFESFEGNSAVQFRNLFWQGNFFCAPSAFGRREVFDTVGEFKPSLLQLQDYDYWLRVVAKFRCKISPHRLLRYRLRDSEGNLSSSQNSGRMFVELYFIYQTALDGVDPQFLHEAFPSCVTADGVVDRQKLQFEKAWIYLGHVDPQVQHIGFSRLAAMMDDRAVAARLRSQLGFNERDLFNVSSRIALRYLPAGEAIERNAGS